MSECVVRMERVPKNCDDGCWGALSGECPWCDHIDGYVMAGNRPPNCPIICQLPEGHGRLGDLDKLEGLANMVRIRVMQKGEDTNPYWECADLILQAPTIVPAERRKE